MADASNRECGVRCYFKRLFPAAATTAAFAALAHATLVAIAARSIGPELVYIAVFSFVVALVVATLGGAVLLAIAGALKLKPIPSLLLFLVAIQAVSVGLEMYFFENSFNDISWQYGLISVPASLIAWYQSVYYLQKVG
ncbi:hypothetical protein [Parahaliea mediterranea]|uniref:Uncharacterized protein n=1 Tax=Parahaliea mediterranea TaxID=651086 RepID=A0A939DGA1_9GAMM|nr:hypothetical protein [Parahaliea mediterranea]MBN7796962.1 hypothetical protein [Parahaliea mediterranea]